MRRTAKRLFESREAVQAIRAKVEREIEAARKLAAMRLNYARGGSVVVRINGNEYA